MNDSPEGPWKIGARHRQGKAVNRRFRGPRGASGRVAGSTPSRWGPVARVRYWFDGALSRGPSVVIGWLGLLTLGIVLVSALVMTLFRVTGVNDGGRLGFAEAFWQSMLRVVDAGTFAADSGWGTRLLGLVVTLAGIFVAGSLIGLIANAVDQRIEQLRRGRSAVLETDHTLILGWSERVPAIVRELVIANESRRRPAVVILADVEKIVMEDRLRDGVDDLRSTRAVCRSGDTASVHDLERGNVRGARSIIVVGNNDASVVKTLLSRVAGPSISSNTTRASGASRSEPVDARRLIGELGHPSEARFRDVSQTNGRGLHRGFVTLRGSDSCRIEGAAVGPGRDVWLSAVRAGRQDSTNLHLRPTGRVVGEGVGRTEAVALPVVVAGRFHISGKRRVEAREASADHLEPDRRRGRAALPTRQRSRRRGREPRSDGQPS